MTTLETLGRRHVAIVGAVTGLGSHLRTTFYDKLAALL
jgi:hypothetical protein